MPATKGKRSTYKVLRKRFTKRRGYGSKFITKVAAYAPTVHKFKEVCELTSQFNISAPAGGNGYGLMSFKLNHLTNATNFKSMFDLYRITGVKIRILPAFDNSDLINQGGLAGAALTIPKLILAPNRSPWAVAPISVADLLNDDGVKTYQATREIKMYLNNPAPRLVDGAGTGMPIQLPLSKFWLSTGGNGQLVDQSNVEYYGIRWALDNQNSTIGTTNYKVYATYYFKLKEQD